MKIKKGEIKMMKEIMVAAHKMTKEIKSQYPEVDYRAQLGLCLSYIIKNKGVYQMELKNLVGTEKQVAWAEDIRTKYQQQVKALAEAEEILRDTTQIEEEVTDPIFGKTAIIKRYARTVSDSLRAWIPQSSPFAPASENGSRCFSDIEWHIERVKQYGDNLHKERLARADYYCETRKNILAALETESEAKFWIENR